MLHTYIRKQWNSQNTSTLPMLEHSLGIMHECCSQMLPYLLLCAPREILTLKKSQNKLGSEDVLVIFSSHQIFMLAPSTWKWSQRSAALTAEKLKNPGHDPGTLLLQMLTYSVKKNNTELRLDSRDKKYHFNGSHDCMAANSLTGSIN